jgi:hypothetical protein
MPACSTKSSCSCCRCWGSTGCWRAGRWRWIVHGGELERVHQGADGRRSRRRGSGDDEAHRCDRKPRSQSRTRTGFPRAGGRAVVAGEPVERTTPRPTALWRPTTRGSRAARDARSRCEPCGGNSSPMRSCAIPTTGRWPGPRPDTVSVGPRREFFRWTEARASTGLSSISASIPARLPMAYLCGATAAVAPMTAQTTPREVLWSPKSRRPRKVRPPSFARASLDSRSLHRTIGAPAVPHHRGANR